MDSLLLKGALVIDGSGKPARMADVLVTGGRVAAIGRIGSGHNADRIADAAGLVLAPGFIDIHSHSDMTLFPCPQAESKVFQGVTLEVTGNCGLSCFPVAAGGERQLEEYLALHDFKLPPEGIGWNDLLGWAGAVERSGLGINVAPMVGHAALRIAAMGMEDRAPTARELGLMRRLLEEALQQGAWGMSTGLIYPPGSYARLEELVTLARTLAAFDSLYTSHIRNEGEGLMAALDEAMAIGRTSGVRVQVSHLKAMGRGNRGLAGEILAKIAAARGAGIDMAADQYPYAASATTLAAIVPQWAHAGGVASLLQRLQAPELRDRLTGEMEAAIAAREGAAGIMISNCRSGHNRHLSGRTIAEIAAGWGCSGAEAVIRLLVEEQGEVGAIFFSMAEDDVRSILADPEVMVGSDGHGLNAAAAAGEATHPRSYGTFTRILGHYVREEKVLSLEAAIHKMTGLPASRLGLKDRGLVREGHAADLVLFDPAKVRDNGDYVDPHRYSAGIVHLLVAGEPVIWDGRLTGRRPGRVLRKGECAHAH
ncbi:D-aminoacylase [Geotalea sp. SG265]|uniref:N-acyl-D-amino-acid deacylase family protein n=1 Tax=Geotalea sp. SG265 TaxID=2922867 RepID=UPI001FB03458|nr:D-aminoacylase [Geotalea sp. SG265]